MILLIGGSHSCCIKSGIGHVVCSVTDDSLWFHGLWPSILLCPFPAPGDLPNPGRECTSLESPALAGVFFTTAP